MSELMAELRLRTTEVHKELEGLEYTKSIMEGTITKYSYANYLKCMNVILANIEASIDHSDHPILRGLKDQYTFKAELIRKDLEILNLGHTADNLDAIEESLALVRDLRNKSLECPLSIIGAVYVFEGSTHGNSALAGKISSSLNLKNGNGTTYLQCYGSKVRENWGVFSTFVNSIEESHDEIIESAITSFRFVKKIFENLWPMTSKRIGTHATSLNYEAGSHKIIQDERLLEIALSSSGIIFDRYPYLEKRYGERGRRYSRSDSAWLLDVANTPLEISQKEISWLKKVLISRGMPSIFLQEQLENLATESKRINEVLGIKLDNLSNLLLIERKTILQEEKFQDYSRKIEDQLPAEWKSMSRLLLSAYCDDVYSKDETDLLVEITNWIKVELKVSLDLNFLA